MSTATTTKHNPQTTTHDSNTVPVIDLTHCIDSDEEQNDTGNDRKLVIRRFGINVMQQDIDVLMDPRGWLNDNIINFYLTC